MTKFLNTYWQTNKEWYDLDENLDVYVKDDTPEEAKESFKRFLKEKEQAEKRYSI